MAENVGKDAVSPALENSADPPVWARLPNTSVEEGPEPASQQADARPASARSGITWQTIGWVLGTLAVFCGIAAAIIIAGRPPHGGIGDQVVWNEAQIPQVDWSELESQEGPLSEPNSLVAPAESLDQPPPWMPNSLPQFPEPKLADDPVAQQGWNIREGVSAGRENLQARSPDAQQAVSAFPPGLTESMRFQPTGEVVSETQPRAEDANQASTPPSDHYLADRQELQFRQGSLSVSVQQDTSASLGAALPANATHQATCPHSGTTMAAMPGEKFESQHLARTAGFSPTYPIAGTLPVPGKKQYDQNTRTASSQSGMNVPSQLTGRSVHDWSANVGVSREQQQAGVPGYTQLAPTGELSTGNVGTNAVPSPGNISSTGGLVNQAGTGSQTIGWPSGPDYQLQADQRQFGNVEQNAGTAASQTPSNMPRVVTIWPPEPKESHMQPSQPTLPTMPQYRTADATAGRSWYIQVPQDRAMPGSAGKASLPATPSSGATYPVAGMAQGNGPIAGSSYTFQRQALSQDIRQTQPYPRAQAGSVNVPSTANYQGQAGNAMPEPQVGTYRTVNPWVQPRVENY